MPAEVLSGWPYIESISQCNLRVGSDALLGHWAGWAKSYAASVMHTAAVHPEAVPGRSPLPMSGLAHAFDSSCTSITSSPAEEEVERGRLVPAGGEADSVQLVCRLDHQQCTSVR